MSGGLRHAQPVIRMAGLFAFGIALFLVLRGVFIADDFGVYGHFRASALDVERAKPLWYGGREVCAGCHTDVLAAQAGGGHAAVACEACHGPAGGHATGGGEPPRPIRPAPRLGCLICHTEDASKPPGFPQIVASDHAGQLDCSLCHSPHHPRIQ
jgi:hypothetical protein